jgi:exosortase C (VPDSG-CTERM-specific)
MFSAVLALAFGRPLLLLIQFSWNSELYSYLLLVPFVSGYLAWLKKNELLPYSVPDRKLAVLPLAAGFLVLAGYLFALRSGLNLAPVDFLAWTTFSFFLLFIGACCFFLGSQTLRTLAFPVGFLIFLVPLPNALENAFESFLQYRTADAAELLFGIVGTPLLRHNVDFHLPGFSLQVAPECSGIRSTLVLFITSLVAGQLFLRSPRRRAMLVLAVIPLGILRNALRVVTIGELCIHVGPDMINSKFHHRGGPLFFLLSLVPFFGLLYVLRMLDVKKQIHSNAREREMI